MHRPIVTLNVSIRNALMGCMPMKTTLERSCLGTVEGRLIYVVLHEYSDWRTEFRLPAGYVQAAVSPNAASGKQWRTSWPLSTFASYAMLLETKSRQQERSLLVL